MALMLFVFVATNSQKAAFNGLSGARKESPSGAVDVSPAVHRLVKMICNLVEVLFDPVLCVPSRFGNKILVKVINGATKCRLNLLEVCGCNLEPVADSRSKRHTGVVIHDETHE